MAPQLDPRIYGLAPLERETHDGVVYLTKVGVMKQLDISEATLRRLEPLMAKRIAISPRKFVWRREDVQAFVESQRPTLTVREARQKVRHKRLVTTGRKQRADAGMRALMQQKLSGGAS